MFREKERLFHDMMDPAGNERSPLIQNPIIWTRSREFTMDGMDPYRYERVKKKQRCQWLVFCTVM
jgi:hypothetical protein